MAQYLLGRRHAPDSRDANFPMKALLKPQELRLYRYWYDNGWWGDQGPTPQCVAYAWTHWLEDGPTTQPVSPQGGGPIEQPDSVYHAAQLVDEWPGENYDGTSVRAGAKVLQTRGYISSYHWAFDIQTVIDAVLNLGPVVVGTNWYSGMFYPDGEDILEATGSVVGGHAYIINGVNLKRGLVRMKNSWGRSWAGDGRAMMTIETLEKLILEDGEACLATEIKK